MADIPFLPTALDPAEVAALIQKQLAQQGARQQGIVAEGLAGTQAANPNAPAFNPEAGPFFQDPSTAAALSSVFLGTQFPGGTPTPGGISPEALQFLSSDVGKGRSRIGAIGTDIAAGVGEAGALVNRLLQAPFDISTALFEPAEKPFLEGTPTGRALGIEPKEPAVGPAPGQRTTQQLLEDFFAARGGGAAGAGLGLPSLPELPGVPQRGAIAPTDFTKFEEAISGLAPSPLGKGEEKGILQTARLAGLAEALQGLPQFASVGDILLAAGTGLLAGKGRGRAELRAEERAYEAKLFEFNKLRADGELAKAEVARNEAEATAERVFRNKTLEFEREMLDLQRRQPKMLGIAPAALGGGTIWQIIGENGQIEIKRESPSAILSAYNTSSALLGQSGAGPKGQALAIPTIPGSFLNAPMQMLRQLNVSQLEPVFGEELLNESLDVGLEASRNMIATGNEDAAGRIATDAQFGILAQAMMQDERLMRAVLEAIGSPIRGNTQ